jgi:hypothetical protein
MKKLIGGWVFIALVMISSISFAQDKPKESGIDIHGFVDTYYSYNFNKPDSRLNGFSNFDFRHNAFSLNLAELVISKSTSDTNPVGFRIDLDFGETTDFIHCGALSCPGGQKEEPFKNIQQAYVTWATPIGLTLDMGKFVTHMGLEVIESKDNWNYTRSLLFCCAIPYYHTGVRANYNVSDILFINGYVYNGWNNVIETNGKKTFGAQIGFTPIKQLPIILNWIGPEDGISFGNEVQVYDAIVSFNMSDALAFAVNYDYGTSKAAATGDKMTWTGVAGYARFGIGNSALAARYEFVDDGDGAMFGAADNKVQEITLTAETKVAGNLLLRLEYRHDMADKDIFEKNGATVTDTQDRVVAGVVYSF